MADSGGDECPRVKECPVAGRRGCRYLSGAFLRTGPLTQSPGSVRLRSPYGLGPCSSERNAEPATVVEFSSERFVTEVGFVGFILVRACWFIVCCVVEEPNFVGDDIETAPVLAGRRVLPCVRAKPSGHSDEATRGQVTSARLGKRSRR